LLYCERANIRPHSAGWGKRRFILDAWAGIRRP
jgi:hypothetical protein